MGSKQKILVVVLILAIVFSFYLGWHFIVKKPNMAQEFAKEKNLGKIAFLFESEKNKNSHHYDELLNKYKELKNKRLALDDEISDIEQQIAKINKVNYNVNSKAPSESSIVIMSDQPTKVPASTAEETALKNEQPQSSAQVASSATTASQKTPEVTNNFGNALTPAITVDNFAAEKQQTQQNNAITQTNSVSSVKSSTLNKKVVIISPKKKHEKLQKPKNTELAVEQAEQQVMKTGDQESSSSSVPAANSDNNEPTIVITKDSVEEKSSDSKAISPSERKSTATTTTTTKSVESAPVVSAASSKHVTVASTSAPTSGKYYVVQVMSSDKAADITDFINKKNLGDKAVGLKTMRNGKDWYIVAYGNYATSKDAANAIKALPASIKSLHPWVKPVSGSEVSNISQ